MQFATSSSLASHTFVVMPMGSRFLFRVSPHHTVIAWRPTQ
jgi:hypothetical protein